MNNNKFLLILFLQISICAIVCGRSTAATNSFQYPTYVGIAGGYGSTTWKGLVPNKENQNLAMSLSTPTEAIEGGGVWGLFAGYEFNPFFALEASYFQYPIAQVYFDNISIFSHSNHGLTSFTTQTEATTLTAKIMLIVPKTKLRAYSSFGAANVRRKDFLFNNWHISPTFGFGFNYNFTAHIMGEFGGSYVAGYGEAQLNPTEVYVPFLISGFVRLAYRF